MGDGERKSGLEQVDGKAKQGFEQESPNHEAAQRDEEARGGVDAEGSDSIERSFQGRIRLNRFRPHHQSDDGHHHRKPQNFDDAVDENAQQHQCGPFALTRIEQPVGSSQNRIDGIGVGHVGGQAGDARKLGFIALL